MWTCVVGVTFHSRHQECLSQLGYVQKYGCGWQIVTDDTHTETHTASSSILNLNRPLRRRQRSGVRKEVRDEWELKLSPPQLHCQLHPQYQLHTHTHTRVLSHYLGCRLLHYQGKIRQSRSLKKSQEGAAAASTPNICTDLETFKQPVTSLLWCTWDNPAVWATLHCLSSYSSCWWTN